MTGHQYLQTVLKGQEMRREDIALLQSLRAKIEGKLRGTFGSAPRFYYGGSYGKKTMIRESNDLDIVMYFPSSETRACKELYRRVHESLLNSMYIVKPKNVALRLPYDGGFHIDVVPGKAQDSSFLYATLYLSETGSTRQTSLKTHIDSLKNQNIREIVKLMKLWRIRNSLDWSSFALEQTVLRALAGSRSLHDYGESVWLILSFLESQQILSIRLEDPANTNNEIAMAIPLRVALQACASQSRRKKDWSEIIW